MSDPTALVALGSTRRPKVMAAERALSLVCSGFPQFLGGRFRLVTRAVPSGTAPTPVSTAELMAGARHRATALREALVAEGQPPALALGLEGGLRRERAGADERDWVLIECWAFVTDGSRVAWGSGGALPLPATLADAVLGQGVDLGAAADGHFGADDVAGTLGTIGMLTAKMVTREDSFVRALVHALAPFYNPGVYWR
jgi:non-canonical (house-cleaning) NTP pyrophosphatase